MIFALSMLIFALLFWATWQGWAAHRLIWLVALGILLASGMSEFFERTQIKLSQAGSDRAFQDTYYVVTHSHAMVTTALFAACLGVLLWAQSHWADPLWPRLQKCAVWAFAIGAVGPQIVPATHLLRPRRYADYEAMFAIHGWIVGLAALLVWIALIILILLPCYTLAFRRR